MEGKVQGEVISSSQHRELTIHGSAAGEVCLDSSLPTGLDREVT